MPETNFDKIVDSIKDLPITWYPGLLIELVKEAYRLGVFVPGGVTKLLKKVEKRIGKEDPNA